MRKRFHIYFFKSQKCFSRIICSIILVKFSAKKGPKFWWELWAARIFDILPFWSSSNIMLLFYASYSIRIELKTNRIWKLGEVEDEEDRKLSQFSLSANAKAASPQVNNIGHFFLFLTKKVKVWTIIKIMKKTETLVSHMISCSLIWKKVCFPHIFFPPNPKYFRFTTNTFVFVFFLRFMEIITESRPWPSNIR